MAWNTPGCESGSSPQSPEDFASWQQSQRAIPAKPTSGQAAQGYALFMKLPCSNCHRIAGTPAQADIGPDLTHLGSRQTLAAGVFDNTPGNLEAWIAAPQKFKPGCNMPDLQLKPHELLALTAYLKELQMNPMSQADTSPAPSEPLPNTRGC